MAKPINNFLISKSMLDRMKPWGSKAVKQFLFALADYAFYGKEPDFNFRDGALNSNLLSQFYWYKPYLDRTLERYQGNDE